MDAVKKVWQRVCAAYERWFFRFFLPYALVLIMIGLIGIIGGGTAKVRWTGFSDLSVGLICLGLLMLSRRTKKMSSQAEERFTQEITFDLKLAMLRMKVNSDQVTFSHVDIQEIYEWCVESSVEEMVEALKEAEMSDRNLARVIHERMEFRRVIEH